MAFTTAPCPVTIGEAAPCVDRPSLLEAGGEFGIVGLVTCTSTWASAAVTMGEASVSVAMGEVGDLGGWSVKLI